MAKLTLNELKLEIAEILSEAKKKKDKIEDLKKKGRSVEAYGLYDEAFDFSSPLGAFNLYKQQGAVNYGPMTSDGPVIDSSFASPQYGPPHGMKEGEEHALRALVREVIENGLIPSDSAWAPLTERAQEPKGPWESANRMFEAWYDRFKKSEKESGKGGKAQGFEKAKDAGEVKKHGFPPKKKGRKDEQY